MTTGPAPPWQTSRAGSLVPEWGGGGASQRQPRNTRACEAAWEQGDQVSPECGDTAGLRIQQGGGGSVFGRICPDFISATWQPFPHLEPGELQQRQKMPLILRETSWWHRHVISGTQKAETRGSQIQDHLDGSGSGLAQSPNESEKGLGAESAVEHLPSTHG